MAALCFCLFALLQQTAPDNPQDPTPTKPAQESAPPNFRPRDPGVTESSTRTPIPIERSPASVTVIPGQVVEDSGVRFFTDILRLVPGFEVSRFSSSESNVSVRSFNSDSSSAQGVMGLYNGRQVYNEVLGNVVWDVLPVSLVDIERVEAIRGPGSFVYGPNAEHGMVNIITRSPLEYDKDRVLINGSAGSYGSSVGSAIYVRRGDDFGFKATLGWEGISEFDPQEHHSKEKSFLELRYQYALGLNHSIEVTVGATQAKVDTLIAPFVGLPVTSEFEDVVHDKFVKLDYRWGSLKASVDWDSFSADLNPIPTESAPVPVFPPFSFYLDTVDLDIQYSHELFSNNLVTAGTGYRYVTFRTANEDVSNGRHATNLEWLFVQDEFNLQHTLFVTGGLRWDRHSTAGDNLSPRLAVVWEITEEHRLRSSVGYGHRAPSLRELYFDLPVGPSFLLGNTDLKTETMRSIEAAYTYGTPKSPLQAQVTLYQNHLERFIKYSQTVSGLVPSNSGQVDARGVEIEGRYVPIEEVALFASYSYGIRLDAPGHVLNLEDPRNKASAGIQYSVKKTWEGMLWAIYFDTVEFQGVSAHQYTLLNARVAYKFNLGSTQGKIFLQGFNLLDEHHRENPAGDAYGLMVFGGLELTF
jgi:iron complex outermembrane receptor protein